ncbi:MAG: response regulator, partial [Epsilonproteobacteria bacterium]|nr:response regulator [Campylobacterota bacterium]
IIIFTQASVEKKGLKLELHIDDQIPSCIITDKDKLRQIILNYVTNAIKYSDKGTITVSIKNKKNKLYIEVSDMGHGIKKEQLQDIFKPFIQVGKASEHTGTGLGLTITKKYAQSLGGDVAVKSTYQKGSTFYATIQYKQCKETDTVERTNHQKIIGVTKPKYSFTSLIVDDNETNRELLEKILSTEFQSKTLFAKNGYEAIEIFKQTHPKIIWIDKKMPQLNGIEATKKIRELPGGKDVIIIGLTASIFEEDKKRLLASGMNEIILKPYKLEDIYMILHKYFDVDYIYEDTPSKDKINFSHQKFIESLKKLDKELLQKLYDKALLLEKEEMKEIIQKISQEDSQLAQTLFYLIDEMQYSVIINNISTILQENSVN